MRLHITHHAFERFFNINPPEGYPPLSAADSKSVIKPVGTMLKVLHGCRKVLLPQVLVILKAFKHGEKDCSYYFSQNAQLSVIVTDGPQNMSIVTVAYPEGRRRTVLEDDPEGVPRPGAALLAQTKEVSLPYRLAPGVEARHVAELRGLRIPLSFGGKPWTAPNA